MKMAKATAKEIAALRDFMHELEEAREEDDEQKIVATVRRFPYRWRAIIEGYQVLLDNACDPSLDYLDFKPEIVRALARPPLPEAWRCGFCGVVHHVEQTPGGGAEDQVLAILQKSGIPLSEVAKVELYADGVLLGAAILKDGRRVEVA